MATTTSTVKVGRQRVADGLADDGAEPEVQQLEGVVGVRRSRRDDGRRH